MRIADSFRIATLFPAAAMRPRRPAEPVREVRMEEKVSDCQPNNHISPKKISRRSSLLLMAPLVCVEADKMKDRGGGSWMDGWMEGNDARCCR